MHPGALGPRQRDQLGEGIERAAADVARLQADHRPARRAPPAPRPAPPARIRPSRVRRRDMHPRRAEAEQPQRQLHRGMHLAADHHRHLRRPEQPSRLDVPAGPRQQRVARRRQRGEIRHRRPGAEADARPRPAARAARAPSPPPPPRPPPPPASDRRTPPFCPQAAVSQSAATPAGCDAPITQPWKFGLTIPRSPPSARAHQLLDHRVRRQPGLRHRPAEAPPASRIAPRRAHRRPATPRRYALACAAAASNAAASASPNPLTSRACRLAAIARNRR